MPSLRRLVPSDSPLSVFNIRWLVVSRFFADLFFYSTTFVVFQQQRGLNFTQMFLLESIISAFVWLFDIPTGVWADRFGYRKLMLAGRVLNVIGMVMFVCAYGFWLFAVASAIGGVAIACISGCESAMVYSSLSAQKKEQWATSAFALLDTASNAGLFCGLLTGSFIGAYSPTWAVAASTIPAILALFTTLRLRENAKAKLEVVTVQKTRVGACKLLRVALRAVYEQPALVGLSIFDTAAFAMVNAIFWYNQPYFVRSGIPVTWFGPLMAAAMALKMLLLLRLPLIQQRLGTRFTLMLSCLLPGIAYALLAVIYAPTSTFLLITCIVAFSGWRQPLVQVEVNRYITEEARATTLSTLSFLGTLAGIALNPLIGRLGDLGLEITGVGIGLGLVGLCLLVPFLVQETFTEQN
jgi:MFS family permease